MKLNEYLDELEEYRLSCYGEFIKGNDIIIREYKKQRLAKIHNMITQEEAKLLRTLVKDNDIEKYFAVYFCLLWNGYFSHDKKFDYSEEFRFGERKSNLALNIVTGQGCCRHIAAHFTNIINEVQKDNDFILVGTKQGINLESIPTNNEIHKKLLEGNKEEAKQDANNKFNPNHVESFDDKNNVCYDLTQFKITRINFDDISDENFTGMYDLGIDSLLRLIENKNAKSKTLEEKLAKSKLLEIAKKEPKPKEELLKIRDVGLNICNDNIKLLKEHRYNTKENYEYIYKKVINR